MRGTAAAMVSEGVHLRAVGTVPSGASPQNQRIMQKMRKLGAFVTRSWFLCDFAALVCGAFGAAGDHHRLKPCLAFDMASLAAHRARPIKASGRPAGCSAKG